MHKAENMTPAHLSLSGAFQPTDILSVENCHFAGYARNSDMYKADIVFADQSSSLQVRAKAFRVPPNDRERNEQLTNTVDMLRYLWSVVGYDHKNISPMWRASVATAGHTVPAIATSNYRNGNIFDYVGLHSSADLLNLMYEASSAFMHIHSKNVVHGDICPENLCIANDGTMRVTDIAVDTLVRQGSNSNSLSVPSNWMYKAPEELGWGDRTTQTDVYSFGATIYSAYNLKPPFPVMGHSYGKGLMQIISQGHDSIFGQSKPAMMSDGLWQVVRVCWAMDPSQRPSMAEVNGMLARMREDSR